jgi:hypothetical protein
MDTRPGFSKYLAERLLATYNMHDVLSGPAPDVERVARWVRAEVEAFVAARRAAEARRPGP